MNFELTTIKDDLLRMMLDAGDFLSSNIGKAIVNNTQAPDIKIDTDVLVEKYLIEEIEHLYPKHNIYSEEKGNVDKGSSFTWIIDPIDGSYHYLRQLPLFSIAVALMSNGSTILGAVFDPITNELFWASRGEGAYFNGNKICISTTDHLRDSLVLCDFPNGRSESSVFESSFETVRSLVKSAYRVRVYGLSSLSMCYVACGRVDAYISLSPYTRIYDKAAGLFILQMAEGEITDSNTAEKHILVASNGLIHKEVLEIINYHEKA